MSVFAVERQRRFSCRCRAAWRTRFSCCLMFGISERDPRLAGRAMVATPLPMLPSWTTPSGSGTSGGWRATAAGASRASRRTSRARRRSTPGRSRRIRVERRRRSCARAATRDELVELEAEALDEEGLASRRRDGAAPTVRQASHTKKPSRGLARSGVIFAIATGVSRVVGLVREIVAAALFGINGRSTHSRSRS